MADKKQEWISAKIAKLIDEGKDQEQASAIAYSMYEEEHKKKDSADLIDHIDFSDSDLSTKLDSTPEGYLKGRAIVTNIGVFTYLNKDGTTRRELRLPEEVFNQDSLDSYVGKPITNSHPSSKTGLVDKTNYDSFAIGTMMGPVAHDESHVSADLVFMKEDGIQAIKSGRRGLSVGYQCRLDWTPGTYLGMNYDCIQRDIRVNHLAIVDKGRAGDAARLRIDNADSAIQMVGTDDIKEDMMAEKNFHTINLDNVDYQAEDAVINALKGEKTRADSIQVKLDALTAEKSTVEAERDALKERADALEKEMTALKADKADEVKINERVKACLSLLEVAAKAEVKTDGLDEKAIKLAIIKKDSPDVNLDGKDDAYFNARFDIAVEAINKKKVDKANASVRTLNTDSAPAVSDLDEAKKRSDASYGKRKEGGK